MKDERIYLRHILECIEAIQDYNARGSDAFLTDRKTCKATLREFQELAESTQRLSDALRERYPEIPWPAIAGFLAVNFSVIETGLNDILCIKNNDRSTCSIKRFSSLENLHYHKF
jgi:predicted RNase H-like nuclease